MTIRTACPVPSCCPGRRSAASGAAATASARSPAPGRARRRPRAAAARARRPPRARDRAVTARRAVQHLGGAGLHPGALARGEDDDGGRGVSLTRQCISSGSAEYLRTGASGEPPITGRSEAKLLTRSSSAGYLPVPGSHDRMARHRSGPAHAGARRQAGCQAGRNRSGRPDPHPAPRSRRIGRAATAPCSAGDAWLVRLLDVSVGHGRGRRARWARTCPRPATAASSEPSVSGSAAARLGRPVSADAIAAMTRPRSRTRRRRRGRRGTAR